MKLGKPVYRGTIAVDIDGVLANFEEKFCEDFGYDNRHVYSLEKRYQDIDTEIIKEYVLNPENYKNLDPIFGGTLFCRQAHQRGWYILLLTSRDIKLREVTKNWLHRYSVVYHELMFSRNKKEAISDYDAINPSRKVKIVVDDNADVLRLIPDKYCVAWLQQWNSWYYPRMHYSSHDMIIKIEDSRLSSSVGIWDKAGKV